jgi:MurNAc alpha-1-phosphate uridylyltransferase
MEALILAAGRGERMRPLTDTCPKPLLPVRGRPLIEWHLLALARDGVRDVVINTAWLEEQFPAALGDGSRFGLRIRFSMEGRDHGGALETAGGIATALPLLQSDTFWVVGGDVFMPDFRFDPACVTDFTARGDLAHLWLVPNPPQHASGDFGLSQGRVVGHHETNTRYTYSGIGLYNAKLVEGVRAGERAALRPCLDAGIARQRIGGSLYRQEWVDVGTPQRWQDLQGAR